jgi:hypothetical protein
VGAALARAVAAFGGAMGGAGATTRSKVASSVREEMLELRKRSLG